MGTLHNNGGPTLYSASGALQPPQPTPGLRGPQVARPRPWTSSAPVLKEWCVPAQTEGHRHGNIVFRACQTSTPDHSPQKTIVTLTLQFAGGEHVGNMEWQLLSYTIRHSRSCIISVDRGLVRKRCCLPSQCICACVVSLNFGRSLSWLLCGFCVVHIYVPSAFPEFSRALSVIP